MFEKHIQLTFLVTLDVFFDSPYNSCMVYNTCMNGGFIYIFMVFMSGKYTKIVPQRMLWITAKPAILKNPMGVETLKLPRKSIEGFRWFVRSFAADFFGGKNGGVLKLFENPGLVGLFVGDEVYTTHLY